MNIPPESHWFNVGPEQSTKLTRELCKEVGPKHVLAGCLDQLVVVAATARRDDVLVAHKNESSVFFLVHLTWAGRRESSPKWPATTQIKPDALSELFDSDD